MADINAKVFAKAKASAAGAPDRASRAVAGVRGPATGSGDSVAAAWVSGRAEGWTVADRDTVATVRMGGSSGSAGTEGAAATGAACACGLSCPR